MNQKVRKAQRDVERAERKLAEIAAELKQLKSDRTKHENDEIVKRVRSVSARTGAPIDEVLAQLEAAAGPAAPAHDIEDKESEAGER